MDIFNKKATLNLVYFLYTLLFFSIQLRLVIDVFYFDRFSVEMLFLALLSLKLGELANEIFILGNTNTYVIVGAISLPMVLFDNNILMLTGCFLFGFSLMKVRDVTICHSTQRVKFFARAVGFLLSPILPFSFLLTIGFISAVLILLCKLNEKMSPISIRWFKSNKGIVGNWCMGIHHFHYFSYAYTIPLIYLLHTNLNFKWLGLVFYIGWAAYNAYERFVKPSWQLILIGHVIAAFSLIMLAHADSVLPMTFWWFMTGLGGGTVYMIQPLVSCNSNSQTELKISEGFGHVFGILAWGGILFCSGAPFTFIVGALGGLIVAVLAFYKIIKSIASTEGK